MATYLLDVNAFFALAWPGHIHHRAAHEWFAARGNDTWATCPFTQCGFMRIALNPHVTGGAVGVTEAVGLLRHQVSHPRHVYWGEGIEIVGAASTVPWERVMGYRQVTDAYLLGLCVARGGKLATFDRGIMALAGTGEERDAVEVIVG